MKIVSLGTLCCLAMATTLSTRVLSNEFQNINGGSVDCNQQAIEAGARPGEEFDLFVVDCELYESGESINEDNLSVELPADAELKKFN
jgi:hypothetical protein